MKAKKWLLDNITFLNKDIMLRIKINGSDNPLDEVNFVITNFVDIKGMSIFKHIFKKEILRINNPLEGILEIIVV